MSRKETDTIQTKAMLAKLSIKRWTATREDHRVSEKVAAEHGAEVGMGRYVKRLVVKHALKAIQVTAYRARHYHYDHTLPWSKDGARILPATEYYDYMAKMREFERAYKREVAKFTADYDKWIKDSRKRLGGLFNADEYPADAKECAELFELSVVIEGLQNPDDWRVKLSDEAEAEIRAGIEKQLNESMNVAVLGVWEKIAEHVKHLIEKLRGYDPKDKGSKPFRDSTIENVKALVTLLPRLNITNDSNLDAMTKRLDDELGTVDAAKLRESAAEREAVAKKADAILDDVAKVTKAKKSADQILKDMSDVLG